MELGCFSRVSTCLWRNFFLLFAFSRRNLQTQHMPSWLWGFIFPSTLCFIELGLKMKYFYCYTSFCFVFCNGEHHSPQLSAFLSMCFPEIAPPLCSLLINYTILSFRVSFFFLLWLSPLASSRLWQNPITYVSRDLLVILVLVILQHLLCHRDQKHHNSKLQVMHCF